MSYRYKQDFGKCFDDLPLPQHEGTISHPLIELDEVYRKAEAFDRIVKNLEKYDEQAIDSLNVNYHDFGGDTACAIDDFKEGLTNE